MISVCLQSSRYPTYQDDVPLLHPVVLLFLQLFLIVRSDPSHGLYAFQGLRNVGATFDLRGHVVDDGFGDREDVAEMGGHIEVVDDDEDA